MEDAIALSDAVVATEGTLTDKLTAFQRTRQPAKQKLLDAMERSYTWYENFPQKMASLDSVDFVFDFMARTGRIDYERLAAEFPEFMRRYAPLRSPSLALATHP
jgi:2-polyprenyl-6-methoxyphenol hydroxylase-like FAD-dependent oxidoreductase